MIQLTVIARRSDGLSLASCCHQNAQNQRVLSLVVRHAQAREVLQKFARDPDPPTRLTLQTGAIMFHVLVDRGLCYLTACDSQFSRRLAFAYLEDLQKQLWRQYGAGLLSVSRSDRFPEFEMYMQRRMRMYTDPQANRYPCPCVSDDLSVLDVVVLNLSDVVDTEEGLSELAMRECGQTLLWNNYLRRAANDRSEKPLSYLIAFGLTVAVFGSIFVFLGLRK